MIFIIYILFFIAGMAFIQWIYPILDSIVGLICTFFEEKKGKITLRLVKMQSMLDGECSELTPAMGFEWCENEELDEEEEEEEEEE